MKNRYIYTAGDQKQHILIIAMSTTCAAFNSPFGCPKGDSCELSHDLPEDIKDTSDEPLDVMVAMVIQADGGKKEDREKCQYWEMCGNSKCQNAHPEGHDHNAARRASKAVKAQSACKFGTECKRSNCRFTHPDQLGIEEKWGDATESIDGVDIKKALKVQKLICGNSFPAGAKLFNAIRSIHSPGCKPVNVDSEADIWKDAGELLEGLIEMHINDKAKSMAFYKCIKTFNPAGKKKKCHNGIDCARSNCKFGHPAEWKAAKRTCRFGVDCTKKDSTCRYAH